MQPRLDQLLVTAVEAWSQPDNSLAGHAKLIGSWRGRDGLMEFASAYPQDNSSGSEMIVPNCVVIAEYARRAIGPDGDSSQIGLLRSECQRVLAKPKPNSQQHWLVQTGRLVRALTYGVLAAVEYMAKNQPLARSHLAQAGAAYDAAWQISLQRIGGQAHFNPSIGEDLTLADPSQRLLDLTHRSGAFGPNGISQPTWLTLRSLLSHVFGMPEPPAICENRLKGLVVRGDQKGQVIHVDVAKLAWPEANPFPFLEPLSFGITQLDRQMRNSLWLATRCCRQSAEWGAGVALRIRFDNPGLAGELGGASAGALIAAGLIATLEEQKLDESKSTTSRLAIKLSAKASKSGLNDENTALSPDDLQVKPIKAMVAKLSEAWQVKHGIDEFFVHHKNADQWRQAHPDCEHPKVTAVDSLADLRDGLWGDRELEQELERHARTVHRLWELASYAKTAPSNPLQPVEKQLEPIERDHRFECYVPPTFRIEGPLRPKQLDANPSSDDAVKWDVATRVPANRSAELLVRHETPVPGNGDDQLLHLLEMSLRGRRWDNAPDWLTPGCELVIYDVAGAGKTVCSYRLAHHLTNPEFFQRLYGWKTAPLVVRLDGRWLRHVDGRLLSLRELLEAVFAEEASRTEPDQYSLVQRTIAYALRRGRVIVVVDGFDQFKPDERAKVVDSFLRDQDGKQCRWIVTSRVHAIDELRGQKQFFLDANWTRVRIDPFSELQQEEYFSKGLSNGKPIGDRWKNVLADREAMAELLGLPMVLWMIRLLIEEADRANQNVPVFYSLSQLYLVTSRQLLARALEKNQQAVNASLAEQPIQIPNFRNAAEKLELLEQVLSLFAFQMMLIGEFNGRLEGKELVERFEGLCRARFLWPIKQRYDQADRFDQDEIIKEREQEVIRWNWALKVLRTIEWSHRSVTEAYGQTQIVFRSRKMLECHAARYLTRYANRWDVFANNDFADRPAVDQELQSKELARLCAWNHTTDYKWKETWLLAIEMPMEPITAFNQDGTIQGAVLDHAVTCESLSALFLQPKGYPGREARPTELIYRAWHLFEIDKQLLSERRFLQAGKLVLGESLDEVTRLKLGEQLLLGVRVRSTKVAQQRRQVIEEFRNARSRKLVDEFNKREAGVLVDAETGRRESISADTKIRQEQLAGWAKQSSYEKSHTFLPCPPPNWIKAYEAGRLDQNPCINPAIEGHETFAFAPMLMQATTVTRWQYRQFDPAFEKWNEVSDSINQRASAFGDHANDDDFPIVCTDWFDAWVFAKWLGSSFCLPNEWVWEYAARAGTTTEYHFGDDCNGSQANCDGTQSSGVDNQGRHLVAGPFVRRTTPVGCENYFCSPWGLYDVHGNVLEWASCWGRGDRARISRSFRGGSWVFFPSFCCSGSSDHCSPHHRFSYLGFRLAQVPSGQESSK